jgi:RNA polymerase sigma-70 factor (ECF subfamily)
MPSSFVSHGGPPEQERRPVSSLADWTPRIYRFALRLTADSHAAEDLTQETLVRAWTQRDRLRDERALRVWLFRIAANLWRDQLRRRGSPIARAGELAGSEICQRATTEQLVEDRDELRRALTAFDALPPRQREVVYLNACEELSSEEIAQILAMSRGAVKANLSLARKRMRELVGDPSATMQ